MPTDRGYRVYVERILRPSVRGESWEQSLRAQLNFERDSLSNLLAQASSLISRLSHALGLSLLVFSPAPEPGEDRVQITGIDELLDQPEFQDPQRLKVLIHLLDDATPIDEYLRRIASNPGEVRLRIGEENTLSDLSQFSLVTTRINRSEESALVALLGPVRMEYPLVLGAMESLVRLLHAGSDSTESWS